MTIQGNGKRNMGIDLLRGLAMFFVIVLHFIGQGGLLAHSEPDSVKYWALSFLQILTYCCVNLYGLTTGYLMCDKPFRLSRIAQLWAVTVFWSVTVSCILFALLPETRTVEELVSMFLPILRGRYWFFTAYFVVMLVSPVLNLVIRSLRKGQFHMLLAVLLLIFGVIPTGALGNDVLRITGGHHFSWMIVLYIIGGYLRRFAGEKGTAGKKWLIGYFAFAAIHLLYKFATAAVGLDGFSGLFLTYPSVFTTGESLCLFLYFKDAFAEVDRGSILGKIVRFAAPGIYSVYVIHVHPKVYWNAGIIGLFRSWDDWNTLAVCAALLGTAAAVFAVCVCLDYLRQRLFCGLGIGRAVETLSNRIETRVRALLGD